MDFALRQMKAMGWSEGKGLGRTEEGITAAIRPNTQMDQRGLGFTIEDSIQLKNQWWNEAYNAARKGLKSELKITSVGVVVKRKKQKLPNEAEDDNGATKSMYNDRFVSAGLLQNKPEESDAKDRKKKKSKRKRKSEPVAEEVELNDDEGDDTANADDQKSPSIDFHKVFKNANGMTCHKAARLGIKMNGKMKRIQEQEEEFLKRLRK